MGPLALHDSFKPKGQVSKGTVDGARLRESPLPGCGICQVNKRRNTTEKSERESECGRESEWKGVAAPHSPLLLCHPGAKTQQSRTACVRYICFVGRRSRK